MHPGSPSARPASVNTHTLKFAAMMMRVSGAVPAASETTHRGAPTWQARAFTSPCHAPAPAAGRRQPAAGAHRQLNSFLIAATTRSAACFHSPSNS